MGNQTGTGAEIETRSRSGTGAWDRQGGANAQSTPNAGKGRHVRRHGRDVRDRPSRGRGRGRIPMSYSASRHAFMTRYSDAC